MPHIQIGLFPGVDDEKKKNLAEKLANMASEELGKPIEYFTVAYKDVKPEDWNDFADANVDTDEIVFGELFRME